MIKALNNRIVSRICRASCSAVLLVLLFGCNSSDEEEGTVIAEAYGKTLYQEELNEAIPANGLTETERTKRQQEYIDNWLMQQVLAEKAKAYNVSISSSIKSKIEKYKTSLMMYEIERVYIEENLDTIVSEKEIETYYKKNIKDFELDDYLVNAIFIKAPIDAPDLNKVNLWFRSSDSSDIQLMKKWNKEHAAHSYYDPESWMYYDEIQKMLPAEMIINKRYFIVNKQARKYEAEDFVYMFRVINFRTGISPLEFEKKNIKSRILQMRIAKLRQQLKTDINNDAKDHSSINRS